MHELAGLPIRGFGVPTPKEVPDRTGRGDLSVPGIEHHADVFSDDGGLDAVVQLKREGDGWSEPTSRSRLSAP